MGGVIVEVGCDLGKSTVVWACVARDRGLTFYTVDNFSHEGKGHREEFEQNMARLGLTAWVNLLAMDCVEAYPLVEGPIDLLFIDGCHGELGMTEHCVGWLPKIKSGGVVIFHDYTNEYFAVGLVADKYTNDWKDLGITRTTKVRRKP